MSWKAALLYPGLVTILNNAAYAAANTRTEEKNLLTDAILGFLPILLFLGILYFVFKKRFPSGLWQKQMDQFERHRQHMERMETLLERIAVALEKRGSDRS